MPYALFPKCLQMGIGVNEHLEQTRIWGKGYPMCPKGVLQVPYAHFPKCLQKGAGVNGDLGQMDIWE